LTVAREVITKMRGYTRDLVDRSAVIWEPARFPEIPEPSLLI
jgi:hypothetical protein